MSFRQKIGIFTVQRICRNNDNKKRVKIALARDLSIYEFRPGHTLPQSDDSMAVKDLRKSHWRANIFPRHLNSSIVSIKINSYIRNVSSNSNYINSVHKPGNLQLQNSFSTTCYQIPFVSRAGCGLCAARRNDDIAHKSAFNCSFLVINVQL